MERIKEIVYKKEFQDVIRANPGALKSFLKLEKEIAEKDESGEVNEAEEESFSDGDVRVTPIYSEARLIRYRKNNLSCYMKVEIGDEAFFVKTVPGHAKYKDQTGGVREYKNTENVAKLLKTTANAEVVESQLGYEDTDRSKTYYVSKWLDLPKLTTVLDEYQTPHEHDAMIDRIHRIERVLTENNMMDVEPHNMFYDKETDKIFVFDIFEERI